MIICNELTQGFYLIVFKNVVLNAVQFRLAEVGLNYSKSLVNVVSGFCN